MKRKESVTYELSESEFTTIRNCLFQIRKYAESDGSESPDLLEDALTSIELIFDDIE